MITTILGSIVLNKCVQPSELYHHCLVGVVVKLKEVMYLLTLHLLTIVVLYHPPARSPDIGNRESFQQTPTDRFAWAFTHTICDLFSFIGRVYY